VVLTKADKISPPRARQVLDQVRAALAAHPAAFPEIMLTSAEKGQGLETLRAAIAAIG
jgi:GTP-binding protein